MGEAHKNCKLEIKLWWVRARKRKNRTGFVTFILSEENFISVYSAFNKLWEYI